MSTALERQILMPLPGTKVQATASQAGKFGVARRRSDAIEWVMFWAFIAALASMPFWYASNERIAWGITAVLFSGLMAIYEVALVVRRQSHWVGIKQLKVPAIHFGAVALWMQAVTLTVMALLGAGVAQSESSRLALND